MDVQYISTKIIQAISSSKSDNKNKYIQGSGSGHHSISEVNREEEEAVAITKVGEDAAVAAPNFNQSLQDNLQVRVTQDGKRGPGLLQFEEDGC